MQCYQHTTQSIHISAHNAVYNMATIITIISRLVIERATLTRRRFLKQTATMTRTTTNTTTTVTIAATLPELRVDVILSCTGPSTDQCTFHYFNVLTVLGHTPRVCMQRSTTAIFESAGHAMFYDAKFVVKLKLFILLKHSDVQ